MLFISKRFLFDNSYLVFNQLLKLFFPLVIIPFSLSLIGIEEFGKIASYLSTVLILCFITDFGINVFGPPRLSSSSAKQSSNLFVELTKFKFICLIITQIIFLFYFLLFQKGNMALFLIFQLYTFGTLLDSLWYFFGTKNFREIFTASFLGISFSIIIITFIFMLELLSNILVIALLFSLPFFLTSLISFIQVLNLEKNKSTKKLNRKRLFFENLRLFISQFISTIYLNIGPIITLQLIGPEASAIWFTINRLSMSLGTFAQVPYKVYFPDIAANFIYKKEESISLLNKSFIYFFLIVFSGLCAFFLFFDLFNIYFFGSALTMSASLAMFFIFWSFIQIVGPVVTGYLLVLEKSILIIIINLMVLLLLFSTFHIFISKFGIDGWFLSICLSQIPNIYFLKFVFNKHNKRL
tara:strand:+ start:1430 stop:2659 length:1230 start_codon:yes stop_codon:yes gene_type:complete